MSVVHIGFISAGIFLALLVWSRNYLLSFFGFLAAALCMQQADPIDGFVQIFAEGFYGQLLDPTKAAMLAFITFYCGYVGFMEYGGAIKGFTRFIAERGGKTKGAVQFRAWIASVGAFFSDLGSPGIVGTLFRREYNDVKLCRERLAILINFTAVPVCSMIPLVGWGLFAIGIINNTVTVIGCGDNPISLFFGAIPYNCLPVLAILTPLLLQNKAFVMKELKGYDEKACMERLKYLEERRQCEVTIDLAEEEGKGFTLFLSLAVMFSVLLLMLHKFEQPVMEAEVYPFMISLSVAFTAASLAAMLLTSFNREKKFTESFQLYTGMFKRTLSVTGIMVMTWTFFETAWKMELYQRFVSYIGSLLPVEMYLPLVFILGAGLSSLTGSAWGTYGVVMPLAILLCQNGELSVFAGIGAAVSAGVYGDISAKNSHAMHYSAQSAGVSAAEFRKAQMPYMYAMGLSCMIAYGIGAMADKWYWYTGTATLLYIILILTGKYFEKRTEDFKHEKELA